jgi:hypothetical protein
MRKNGVSVVLLTATSVLVAMPAIADHLREAVLRASFCLGSIQYSIEQFSKPPPPMYLAPDGKGYTPPAVARAQQEDTYEAIRVLLAQRERLRRFLLPSYLDNELLLPLAAAQNDGKMVFRACVNVNAAKPSSQACSRVRRCFPLDWLPY